MNPDKLRSESVPHAIPEFVPRGNISPERLREIFRAPLYFEGHFEYPISHGDKKGLHRDAILLPETFAEVRYREHAVRVARDIAQWLCEGSVPQLDGILAPHQPGVRELAELIAIEYGRSIELSLLDWKDEGWFGDELVYGVEPLPGSQWAVFNAITHEGSCVGMKLPGIIERYHAETVAAATFATGKKGGVERIRRETSRPYYSAVELDIMAVLEEECGICQEGNEAKPWTTIVV